MSQPAFSLSRASLRDYRRLAEISNAAFEDDAHSQMKAAAQKPGAFAEGMAQGIKHWIEAPRSRCAFLKATNDSDGTVMGSVAWCFRGVPMDEVTEGTEAGDENYGDKGGFQSFSSEHQKQSPDKGTQSQLQEMTSSHLSDFVERIMPEGTECMYIGGITVHPEYQGKGVGSKMISWGTTQADRAGVFCWVHSSEAGWQMFAKHGFKVVDRLTIDLDEWAAGKPPEGNAGKWGMYTFRYMVREPVLS